MWDSSPNGDLSHLIPMHPTSPTSSPSDVEGSPISAEKSGSAAAADSLISSDESDSCNHQNIYSVIDNIYI